MEQGNLLSWLSWKGRINRLPYILTNLLVGVFGMAVERVSSNSTLSAVEALAWLLAVVLVSYLAIMITIRRAHDRGRTGFFVLLFLVPIINVWPLIELAFFCGTNGPNEFGDDPLKEPTHAVGSSHSVSAPDASSHEPSGVVRKVAMEKKSQRSDRGFVVGLIVGAFAVLLTGLAVFYWTSGRVPVTSTSLVEESASKAAPSEAKIPSASHKVTPPDSQIAVDIIRQGRKGSEADVTKLWFQRSFTLGGEQYHVVFTQTPQVDSALGTIEECHACGVMVGAVTYKLVSNRWELLSTQGKFLVTGAYGEAPAVAAPEFLELSSENGVILISVGSSQGGYAEMGKILYGFSSPQWRVLGSLGTGSSNGGACDPRDSQRPCYDYEGTISVAGGKAKDFPDLVVTYQGSDEEGRTPPPERYRFDGKEYRRFEGR